MDRKLFQFTEENLEKIQKESTHYPKGCQSSVVLFALDTAQRQNEGRLTQNAVEAVAILLEMPVIRVLEVATFHTLFHFNPVGKFHLKICGTPPCSLSNSEGVRKACESYLALACGEVTQDGIFSLEEVECLGACTEGPVMQINDDYYGNLSPESVLSLLEDLRKKASNAS